MHTTSDYAGRRSRYGTQRDCLKGHPEKGNKVVVMGGDNYRIGLGGGSVSSVETGRYSSGIELNAVQRANAEMQNVPIM